MTYEEVGPESDVLDLVEVVAVFVAEHPVVGAHEVETVD